MDIGKSFTFVFEDEDWIVKVLIGAAILLVGVLFSWVLLIPIILAFLLLGGYGVEITRRVIRGDARTLPDWNDWGALISDGLKLFVIVLVYALPFIIISACLGVPVGILSGGTSRAAQAWSSLFGTVLGILNFLWAIAVSILVPAAVGFFVDHGDLAAAFRFGEVFAFVREHFANYLITFLISWVAQVIGSLGAIVCGVGWFVTVPYSYMVTGHLYGQAYLAAKGAGAQPVVVDEEFTENA
jgi:hypothetical protein